MAKDKNKCVIKRKLKFSREKKSVTRENIKEVNKEYKEY